MKQVLNKLGGPFLKDSVYAANDGIVTTFAIVAGVAGASLGPFIILILGFANLLADGFSMATGNYLGTKSESDHYHRERDREAKVLEYSPEAGYREMKEILLSKGYAQDETEELATMIMKNQSFFLDFVIFERLGITPSTTAKALKGATVTFVSFMIAGLIPLLPFVFFRDSEGSSTFLWASIFTGAALFMIGAARTFFSDKAWWVGGLEMFIAGGAAALIAFVIGVLLKGLLGGVL